jgi:hypothetical protein
VLSFILTLACQTAIDQAFGRSTRARWRPLQRMLLDSNEGRQRRIKLWLAGDSLLTLEDELDRLSSPEERRKSLGERQESLRKVSAGLEQRRKAIKAGDQEALASYEAVRRRYDEMVRLMRADYAASQVPLPPSAPAAR